MNPYPSESIMNGTKSLNKMDCDFGDSPVKVVVTCWAEAGSPRRAVCSFSVLSEDEDARDDSVCSVRVCLSEVLAVEDVETQSVLSVAGKPSGLSKRGM